MIRLTGSTLLTAQLGQTVFEGKNHHYRLGEDALDVLRDIKKWIRFYDGRRNRMDVARCLADANLVSGDLIHIVALWAHSPQEDTRMFEIALTCYEILTSLTWPIETGKDTMTNNHHRHVPVLHLAQAKYKQDILNFEGAKILHAAVRVALPSVVPLAANRTHRDVKIIELVLSFLRNMAGINNAIGHDAQIEDPWLSRSAILDAFSTQDILFTLLTFASNISEDCDSEGLIIVETVFHLIKRVDVGRLFLNHHEISKTDAGELAAAMKKEASEKRSRNRRARTRHSHFGTEFRIERQGGRVLSVPSLAAVADTSAQARALDESKTFRPSRRAAREIMEPTHIGPPVKLSAHANQILCGFVREFLDCCFNPLFQHVRKALEKVGDDGMSQHSQWFFYTVAWFLKAERARQEADKSDARSLHDEVSRFELVAGALNQEMFVALKRSLYKSFNDRDWRALNSVMRCFTQVLLTVQEMLASDVKKDSQIAYATLGVLFRDENTRDTIINTVRGYKDQGFDYLDSCTELVHTYMRVLGAYSRARTGKRTSAAVGGPREEEATGSKRKSESSGQKNGVSECTAQELKGDIHELAGKLALQAVVDTFVAFTKYYRDLDEEQLKRAHRYFYRVAFRQEMSVMLFRVDIIHLFYNMIKGPESLDKTRGMYKDWEELVKQVIRRCVKKLQQRPALFVELLFSKVSRTACYLETGTDAAVLRSSTLSPAA